MQATLRHWEYYGLTERFSRLYEDSAKGKRFKNLYELIVSEENILLAYRSIKRNKGSRTAGADSFTIDNYEVIEKQEFVMGIRESLANYKPKAVRRVWIPKLNGDKRPLGIPAMRDRLVQQMFKQVLEPICEAKFYNHSFGFRPLRGAQHAKARCDLLINQSKLYYVVDVDIRSFFDNVNHTRLMKQLWNIGIQDRRVLAIISKMLKAPIKGEGVPSKGVPQGGILSPLLSNIVLNDLDHWVSNQWENFNSNLTYTKPYNKYASLKGTNLKEGWIVRYADDFKIFCRSYKAAEKWFHATREFLYKRLGLEVSGEKSKIINLRRKSSEFLGFTLKAKEKGKPKRGNGKKYVSVSSIRSKKVQHILTDAKQRLRHMQSVPTRFSAYKWNAFVLGLHNYFRYASQVNLDFNDIAHKLSRTMHNRLRAYSKKEYPKNPSDTYKRLYGKYKYKTWKIDGIYLFPLACIKRETPLGFQLAYNPYTESGRKFIHDKMEINISVQVQKLIRSHIPHRSVEYIDNRISRYSMRKGKCEVTQLYLQAEDTHCHHAVPFHLGGTDNFSNLRIVHKDIHILIHARDIMTIDKYSSMFNLDTVQIKRLNNMRTLCGLKEIH
ncbi:group II intron reverse transcriptase/maturase [Ectobacillus ponti]|uniref:Group II intron reverse transcriptase/maturase n=1 Tax=Ectobacillus ponti TaxID=2961894 RepID=A0AA41X7Y7_9BACI|nr:group II intron reverse transcriptase/maturase [Ectobacillus ponti]MCP8968540.1 group II intron reverse transcriptase/maturase [Ectobacillus ponti]